MMALFYGKRVVSTPHNHARQESESTLLPPPLDRHRPNLHRSWNLNSSITTLSINPEPNSSKLTPIVLRKEVPSKGV